MDGDDTVPDMASLSEGVVEKPAAPPNIVSSKRTGESLVIPFTPIMHNNNYIANLVRTHFSPESVLFPLSGWLVGWLSVGRSKWMADRPLNLKLSLQNFFIE